MINVYVSEKSIVRAKKIIFGFLAHVIFENSRYLKSVFDDSVISCDDIIKTADSVTTNVKNTVPANVTDSASTNSHDKNVKYKIDCSILKNY